MMSDASLMLAIAQGCRTISQFCKVQREASLVRPPNLSAHAQPISIVRDQQNSLFSKLNFRSLH